MIKRNIKWLYLTLPYNATIGPISTLITLQIISLGGNALDIAYVISLGNLVLIPSSIFWGYTADRISRRKQIITSFSGTAFSLFLLSYSRNVQMIALGYSLLIFTSTASTTPFNLLVMESASKKEWGALFSRYSFLSSIGTLIGLLISTFLVIYMRIFQIIFILAVIMAITSIISVKILPEPILTFERTAILHHKESFFTRLLHLPLMFLHLPNPHHFKLFKLSRLLKKPINYVPLLYIAIVIFYISSGIFNTVYPASLYVKGLDKSEALAVITMGMIFQIIGFRISEKLIKDKNETELAHKSLLLRGGSYFILGVSTLLFYGQLILILGLIFYPLAAGIAFAIYYSSSNTLIFKIVGERSQGKNLGVYSTVVGIALFLGSLLSGYITHYLSYGIDFITAGILLFISSLIFRYLEEG
ncbi:MFS transporter [Sulfurisphaera tokodaii]|nr:MFS transporter [Sulfurisphaera tokodaii]HII73581.1 MFS transporter [Sulfurisphaera tokodaii]